MIPQGIQPVRVIIAGWFDLLPLRLKMRQGISQRNNCSDIPNRYIVLRQIFGGNGLSDDIELANKASLISFFLLSVGPLV